MWQTAEAWPAALAASAAAADLASWYALPPPNLRRISEAVSSSPRANARVRAIAARGRSSSGHSASNKGRTRSAHTAAHSATNRRSRSEEHTSELQSLMRISYAVFCLKTKTRYQQTPHISNL